MRVSLVALAAVSPRHQEQCVHNSAKGPKSIRFLQDIRGSMSQPTATHRSWMLYTVCLSDEEVSHHCDDLGNEQRMMSVCAQRSSVEATSTSKTRHLTDLLSVASWLPCFRHHALHSCTCSLAR